MIRAGHTNITNFKPWESASNMASNGSTPRPHAVMVPYPAQGHVNPMMTLAKLLHSRGFHITMVNTEFVHSRLIRSNGPESVKGLPDFRFETIPDGLPVPSDEEDGIQDIPLLCYYTRLTCLEPFKKLVSRLNSGGEGPPVSCIIADGVMSFGIRAARDLGIREVQLWTASVCSFIGYLNYRGFIARGLFPFKNEDYLTDGTLDTPVDWIQGMRPSIRLRDLPSFIRTTDPNDIMFDFLGEEAQNCLKAPYIIFNTFHELEKESLNAVISHFNYTDFYTIGPLHLLSRHVPDGEEQTNFLNSCLWKPDSNVLEWLDSRQPESVVYVNYGSITTMSAQHFREFAWGLVESKHPFLWIIRPDVVRGESRLLEDGFFEAIKDRGLIVSWCAQDQVLAHKAVGAFLTHCGWNSNLESISAGVPVICWPFFADQQTNCHYSCTEWGIGVEVDHDVKRGEVAKLIKEMLKGEQGKKMRMKAKEWKRMAEKATDVGGGSYEQFDEFIKKVLLGED